MKINIRPFTPSDMEFIESLVNRFSNFDLPAWRSTDEIDNANRVSIKKAMEKSEPASTILIAEDEEGKPAGFIHLQSQTDYFNGEKTAYLSDLAVDISFEGRGVGRKLIEAAEGWARAQSCSLLTLYVFAGNTRARQIYEKYGFGQEVVKYAKPLIIQDRIRAT